MPDKVIDATRDDLYTNGQFATCNPAWNIPEKQHLPGTRSTQLKKNPCSLIQRHWQHAATRQATEANTLTRQELM